MTRQSTPARWMQLAAAKFREKMLDIITNHLRWLRLTATACIVALAILSWMPADQMVRTDIFTGLQEHAVSHLLTGLVVALAWIPILLSTALMIGVAGILEPGQHFVEGRNPALDDFLASSFGGVSGIVSMRVLMATLRVHGFTK